ncbi:hypothetical protein K490DRAFT_46131 [Saccharata proteae CBS 121410]|uniref:DUF3752 domain-containing protein n=1 Tax=Saccharata proteae CBS 121410 TaxID=1314787 RepID=A0A9P4HRN0_9PEZI|nr:hypothetical protein K490DRAFT_46131 [Saccharata proteae CBS 121410]
MSTAGPELPPHLLAKRKRATEQEEQASASATPSQNEASRSTSPDGGEKRRRVMGPAMPPAPLDQMPPPAPQEDEGSDSSSDDDFGPAPPPANAPKVDIHFYYDDMPDFSNDMKESDSKPQRDEWMMLPPKADDLSARMDPTKLRARGFNTGKSARGANLSSGADGAMWTETPEQKRKRLENEVMGVTAPASQQGGKESKKRERDEETARRIREHAEKTRGKSLYEAHKGRTDREEEDDPSKRAFDREKDMGAGLVIGHKQRKEMLSRAKDFGSKFSGGGFL